MVVKFISEQWNITTITIGFEMLIGEHKGENLGEALATVLKDYNLLDKVRESIVLF